MPIEQRNGFLVLHEVEQNDGIEEAEEIAVRMDGIIVVRKALYSGPPAAAACITIRNWGRIDVTENRDEIKAVLMGDSCDASDALTDDMLRHMWEMAGFKVKEPETPPAFEGEFGEGRAMPKDEAGWREYEKRHPDSGVIVAQKLRDLARGLKEDCEKEVAERARLQSQDPLATPFPAPEHDPQKQRERARSDLNDVIEKGMRDFADQCEAAKATDDTPRDPYDVSNDNEGTDLLAGIPEENAESALTDLGRKALFPDAPDALKGTIFDPKATQEEDKKED